MPPNRKSQDFLLILSPEEREGAEAFIARRLKLIGADRRSDLEGLLVLARETANRLQGEARRLDARSRVGAIRARVYQNAIQATADLAEACAGAVTRLQADAPDAQGPPEPEEDLQGGDPIVRASSEELEHALEIVYSAIADMSLDDLRQLREACGELITWWTSDRGQAQSLHLNQFGDVATASGRIAIRKAREDVTRDHIMPLRSFFQEMNLAFQKRSQESRTSGPDAGEDEVPEPAP